ncbi:hypothetical protein A2U01_0092204, partial [Trifolium medium]|nr:hypothetical protein [Trifolium medium]
VIGAARRELLCLGHLGFWFLRYAQGRLV